MRPVIGIGAYPRLVETAFGPTRMDTASRSYTRAVERAGGVAIVLPVTERAALGDALGVIHGVLLTGGGDVAPSRYGATPIDGGRGVDPERDAFEVALFEESLASGIPTFGVCRGMQLMNVVLGGTLLQDVFATTGQRHDEGRRWSELVHRVTVEPESQLAGALGVTELGVNSAHRQGIDRLATGIRPVAWAEDASIEAIEAVEADGDQFFFGVQWHPELMTDHPGQLGLFSRFVEQARRYATLGT